MFHRFLFIIITPFIFLMLLWGYSSPVKAQPPDEVSETWLKVRTNLDQFYVIIDNDFSQPYLLWNNDSLAVSPGEHEVTLVWKEINDYSSSYEFEENKTNLVQVRFGNFPIQPHSSYRTVLDGYNLRIITDERSTIYYDGEVVGVGQAELISEDGKHTIFIEHPEFGSLQQTIETNTYRKFRYARFNEDPSILSPALEYLPGGAYFSSRQYKKALITSIITTGLIANLIVQQNRYSNFESDFSTWKKAYNTAETSKDAVLYRQKVRTAEQNLKDTGLNFNITLATLAAVYLASTLDGFRKPKDGYSHSSVSWKPKVGISSSSGFARNNHPLVSLTFNLD